MNSFFWNHLNIRLFDLLGNIMSDPLDCIIILLDYLSRDSIIDLFFSVLGYHSFFWDFLDSLLNLILCDFFLKRNVFNFRLSFMNISYNFGLYIYPLWFFLIIILWGIDLIMSLKRRMVNLI